MEDYLISGLKNAHAIGIIKTITMKNAINYGST
jgi:hypothetical protein